MGGGARAVETKGQQPKPKREEKEEAAGEEQGQGPGRPPLWVEKQGQGGEGSEVKEGVL